jgi:hypothetical protein
VADNRTDEERAKDCEKTLRNLISVRQPYEPLVEDVLKFVNHSRRGLRDTDANRGKRTGTDVYDGTALSALNLLVDGMCGYSVSQNFHWFDYTLPGTLNFPRYSGMRAWSGKRMDEYPEVKQWLDDCEEVIYSAFLSGNFYDVMPEIVREAASIGTVTVFTEEDTPRGRTIYTVPHFRECYVAENKDGFVDTIYRVYPVSLRNLASKFGNERMKKVDPAFDTNYKNNPYQEKEIIHAIYPRSDYDPNLLNAVNKPWASMWMLRSPQKVLFLGESGFDNKPAMTWRWRKNSDEIYGRGCGSDAIVATMTANQQGNTNLVAGQKMAEPPMMAPQDLRGMINSGPGGWTWMLNTEKNFPRPMVTGIQLPFAIEQQERSDKAIREFFSVEFFLLLSQAAFNKVQLTATQVIEMSGEKAAVLGTRIGRMQSELLNPTHDRQFEIERRAGRIPTPPQIIMDLGGTIRVEYLGPLAQAQKKMFRSQTIRAGIQMIGEMSNIYPQVAFVIDPVKTAKDLLETQGFPVKDFRSDDEIKAIMEEMKQRQELEKTIEAIPSVSKGIKAVSGEVKPTSPLAAMTGEE